MRDRRSLPLGRENRMTVLHDLVARCRARRRDLLAAGSALVDVLERVDAEQPERLGMRKGFMNLVDRSEAQRIYAAMGETHATSGGSAANTAATLGHLGVRAAFAGKIADDQFGEIFAHDLRAANVEFNIPPVPDTTHVDTGRSLILVTPDSDRTMCTELGASRWLDAKDVTAIDMADFGLVYLESYLLDDERNRQAFDLLIQRARESGTGIALSLSDPGCVERHGDHLRAVLSSRIDILFGNEEEMVGLQQVTDHEQAIATLQGVAEVVALTRGEHGAVVATPREVQAVPAFTVDDVVDTTGAGDMFAAGFLYGVLTERDVWDAARIGALVAAEVLVHLGARPESDVAMLLRGHGWFD